MLNEILKEHYTLCLPTAVKGTSILCLLLQFGHFGCIQTHGHTGSSGCVTHFSDHTSPLFLVLFIPENTGKTFHFCYNTHMRGAVTVTK